MSLTPEQRAAVLSLAELIGEAIAMAHLSGKNANAPTIDRGTRMNVPLVNEDWNDEILPHDTGPSQADKS